MTEELKKQVEAILFSAGRKVSLEEISKLCKIKEEEIITSAVDELKNDYDSRNSPILLIGESDGWKMTVRESYLQLVKDINPNTELNKALLETLAMIAWKQPIMQADLVKARTSNAYEHIKELLDMGFISKEKHGRTYLIKPTGRFFDYFDLPGNEGAKTVFKEVEDEHNKAEEEINGKVGDLEVYNVPENEKEKEEIDSYDEEKIGKLEVYAEKKEAEKKAQGKEGEESEDAEGEEEGYEFAEEGEESDSETGEESEEGTEEPAEGESHEDFELGEDLIQPEKEIEAEEKEGNNQDNGVQSEEEYDEDKTDIKTSHDEVEERHLPKELEKFAGIEQTEKGKEKDSENEEEPEEEKQEDGDEETPDEGGDAEDSGEDDKTEEQEPEDDEETDESEEKGPNIDEMIEKHS